MKYLSSGFLLELATASYWVIDGARVHACGACVCMCPLSETNHIIITIILCGITHGSAWDPCRNAWVRPKWARRVERSAAAVRRGGWMMVFVGEAALPAGAVVWLWSYLIRGKITYLWKFIFLWPLVESVGQGNCNNTSSASHSDEWTRVGVSELQWQNVIKSI